MVTINLYQPRKISYEISFPSEWNELWPEELFLICKHQLSQFKTLHEQLAAIFDGLLLSRTGCLKKKLPNNFNLFIDLDDAAMNALPLIDFLHKENRLTKQLMPVINLPRMFGKKMYGPTDDFNNLTCGEFEDAEILFYDFLENPRTESLAHLAAVLWRPKDVTYMQFNRKKNRWLTYDHEQHYTSFLQLKNYQLYAMFVWYAGCRNTLPLIFPTMYKPDPKQQKSSEPDLMAFTKCIHGGAGPKNGNRDDIRRTLIKEFFMELELEAVQAEKLLEEYGKRNG
jgi:hypothetical protein